MLFVHNQVIAIRIPQGKLVFLGIFVVVDFFFDGSIYFQGVFKNLLQIVYPKEKDESVPRLISRTEHCGMLMLAPFVEAENHNIIICQNFESFTAVLALAVE